MLRIFHLYKRAILFTSLATLSIGGAAGAYFYFQYKTRETHLYSASHRYLQLMQSLEDGASRITNDTTHIFMQRYSDTPYASLLQLQLAKQAVDSGQLTEAIKWLKIASEEAVDPNIRCLARQRGARVLIAMGHLEEALSFLSKTMYSDAYLSSIEELKGDIYQAIGKTEKALQAYQKAHKAAPYLAEIKPSFLMKATDLGLL